MYMKDPFSKSGLNESKGFFDTTLDLLTAPGKGFNDYFTDEFNKIPGLNLRRDLSTKTKLHKVFVN